MSVVNSSNVTRGLSDKLRKEMDDYFMQLTYQLNQEISHINSVTEEMIAIDQITKLLLDAFDAKQLLIKNQQ